MVLRVDVSNSTQIVNTLPSAFLAFAIFADWRCVGLWWSGCRIILKIRKSSASMRQWAQRDEENSNTQNIRPPRLPRRLKVDPVFAARRKEWTTTVFGSLRTRKASSFEHQKSARSPRSNEVFIFGRLGRSLLPTADVLESPRFFHPYSQMMIKTPCVGWFLQQGIDKKRNKHHPFPKGVGEKVFESIPNPQNRSKRISSYHIMVSQTKNREEKHHGPRASLLGGFEAYGTKTNSPPSKKPTQNWSEMAPKTPPSTNPLHYYKQPKPTAKD